MIIGLVGHHLPGVVMPMVADMATTMALVVDLGHPTATVATSKTPTVAEVPAPADAVIHHQNPGLMYHDGTETRYQMFRSLFLAKLIGTLLHGYHKSSRAGV